MWYIASYPKSGNTWVRIFIIELLNLISTNPKTIKLNSDICTGEIVSSRMWVDDQLGITSSDLDEKELFNIRYKLGSTPYTYSDKYSFHKVHDSFVSPTSQKSPIVSLKNCKGIIYIIRNPIDIVISLSHYYSWDYEKSIEFMINSQSSLCSRQDKSFTQVKQHLGRWDEHVLSWTSKKITPLIIIRYEDLINFPYKNFSKISEFLYITNNKELINSAIEKTSFENLKQKEIDEGGFVENSSKKGKFFRSGKVGEGYKKLNKDQLNKLNFEFGKTLQKWDY